jgi:pimeloyl-ACP methyl ester carboxylesterase
MARSIALFSASLLLKTADRVYYFKGNKKSKEKAAHRSGSCFNLYFSVKNTMISTFNGSTLFCQREGHGPQTLLFFHGFGQSHQVFAPIANALAESHTCYSFDLYFHGKSEWASASPLTKMEWKQILSQFLRENNIEKFSVAGFSLGAKLAMNTFEAFPERITHLTLIAPDGIKTSLWYSLATYPFFFRKLFKSMILHPSRFFSLAKFFNKVGLVNKGLLRFAAGQMDTEEKRKRVYYAWITFRLLSFHLKSIGDLINQHHIKLTLVVGEFDQVIKPKNMQRLIRHVQDIKVITAPTGHNGLLTPAILKDVL